MYKASSFLNLRKQYTRRDPLRFFEVDPRPCATCVSPYTQMIGAHSQATDGISEGILSVLSRNDQVHEIN